MKEDSSRSSSSMLKLFLRRIRQKQQVGWCNHHNHHHEHELMIMKTMTGCNSSGDDHGGHGTCHSSDLLIGEDNTTTATATCSNHHDDDDLLSSNLPTEVHLKMLSYLDIQSLNVMMTTSKTWCSFLQSPDANQLWWKRCQRVWNLVPAPSSSNYSNKDETSDKEDFLWNKLKLVDDSHHILDEGDDDDRELRHQEQQQVINLRGLLFKTPRHRQPTTMRPLSFGPVGRSYSPLKISQGSSSGSSLRIRINFDDDPYNTSQVLTAQADCPLTRPTTSSDTTTLSKNGTIIRKKKKKCLAWVVVLRKKKKHAQWNPFVSPYSIAGESLHTIHVTPRLVSYYEITVEANDDKSQEERHRERRRRITMTPERQMLLRLLFLYGYYDYSILGNEDSENYKKDCIVIGLGPKEFDNSMDLPGWDGDGDSFGYHSNTGGLYHGGYHGLGATHETAEPFGTGDTVGMGIDYVRRGVFVTKNGKLLGLFFDRLKVDYLASTDMYPVVGMDSKDTVVVNYGGCGKPFLFDLADYCRQQQQELPAK